MECSIELEQALYKSSAITFEAEESGLLAQGENRPCNTCHDHLQAPFEAHCRTFEAKVHLNHQQTEPEVQESQIRYLKPSLQGKQLMNGGQLGRT